MILIDQPYVSDFLIKTIKENKFQIMPAMPAFNTGYCRFRDFSKKCNNVMDKWNKFTDLLNGQRTVGIKKSIMPDFNKSFGKNMLQESSDKLHGIQSHDFPFFLFTIFVQKFDSITITHFYLSKWKLVFETFCGQ